ncbi:MAG: serine hydrolase [Candidatus Zixiibacteriota bacterium]
MSVFHRTALVCLVFLTFAATVIFSLFLAGDVKAEDEHISQVENTLLPPVLIQGERPYTLEERMQYYHVPGVSIAVINDYKIDWIKHYGLSDAELGTPVTDSTMFGVGSLSKAAGTAVILHLVYEGRLGLDDDVRDYLRSWNIPENEFTKESAITVRRLLNHSGGFRSSPPHSFSPDNMPSVIEYLNGDPQRGIQPAVIDYTPGTAFHYSNSGFGVLQVMAEDITGEPFAEFARKSVFEPLGMARSTFEQPLPAAIDANASAGHDRNGRVYEIKRYAYPCLLAGGFWSTAEDYAKFVIEIQRILRGDSSTVMSPDLARQMTSPQEAKEYGLGVFMRYRDDVTYFSHIGDLRGFVAGFTAHPTDGYGAVVMTNGQNGINLAREIMAGVASVYGWQSYLPKVRGLFALDADTKAQYLGRYLIGFDQICRISEQNGILYAAIPGNPDLRLYPVTKDTLVSKERLGHIVFSSNADGIVNACIPFISDDIGRLPASETIAGKLSADDKTPLEMVLAGELEEAIEQYKQHKQDAPDDPQVSESRFNRLGYQLLSQDNLPAALAIFQLNTELYPESGNCWDSFAEAQFMSGHKEESLRLYKKALEINPKNDNAKKWIEKLEAEVTEE